MVERDSADRIDTASIEIAAAPDAVYAAFADPDVLMKWLPPGNMIGRALEFDFREGGRYRFALSYADATSDVGKTAERTDVSAGKFLALEPGQRIVQSVEFESTDPAFAGEMIMTWSFVPSARGTTVTITAEHVPRGISRADHMAGLRSSLENLAKYTASR